MTTLRYGAATDVGRVRSNNEDSLVVAEPLFAVADGMGGHAAGEVASQAAVEALKAAFEAGPPTVETLCDAVAAANRAVWDRAAGSAEFRGMGTTITAVALVTDYGEDHLAVANVGDSRAYLFRDGELEQLTDDHSVAEQMVREGQLLPEEAAVHPQRHVLTRVLGMAPEVDVDCFPILPFVGDRILLCSDGLVNEVQDSQIASLLRRRADPQEAVRELVEMAKNGGGHDNITVVLVDVVDDDGKAARASAALAGDAASAGSDATIAAPIVPPTSSEGSDTGDGAAPAGARSVTAVDTIERPAGHTVDDEPVARAPRSRRITVRVVVFLVLFIAVLGGAAVALRYYARASYFVGLDGDQVAIYKGRPGGLLWFDPTVQERTGIPAADVPPSKADAVKKGVEEPNLARARTFVRNMQAEHDSLTSATTVPTAPTTTAPTTVPGQPPDTTAAPTTAPANP